VPGGLLHVLELRAVYQLAALTIGARLAVADA
jgi:hypothetical protein